MKWEQATFLAFGVAVLVAGIAGMIGCFVYHRSASLFGCACMVMAGVIFIDGALGGPGA
jgi:ABC-type Mn2+/Zn2+ transport system permease subunit